jgi:hypothetical protein
MSIKDFKPPYVDYDDPPELQIPERRLLVAVIQRAIIDYSVPVYDRPHLRYWASAWLFSDSKEIMSLYWISSYLSEDPEGFQEAVRRSVLERPLKKNSVVVRVDRGGK